MAYVVKPMNRHDPVAPPTSRSSDDSTSGRACHVFECGYGLAHEVITTLGQAFHLRYNNYVVGQSSPAATAPPTAVTVGVTSQSAMAGRQHLQHPPIQTHHQRQAPATPVTMNSNWNDDYYNDRPGAQPPLEVNTLV